MTDFAAPDFLPHLDQFLRTHSVAQPTIPAPNSTFPLYKRFTLELLRIATISTEKAKDIVTATKPEPEVITAKGIKKAKPGNFSTVLVRIHPKDRDKGPLDGA